MKYIVMECHYSYAVLLDEKGKFVKLPTNLWFDLGIVSAILWNVPLTEKKKFANISIYPELPLL